jgi:hypothetical protein
VLKKLQVSYRLDPMEGDFTFKLELAKIHQPYWGEVALAKARAEAEKLYRAYLGLSGSGVTAAGHKEQVEVDPHIEAGRLSASGTAAARAYLMAWSRRECQALFNGRPLTHQKTKEFAMSIVLGDCQPSSQVYIPGPIGPQSYQLTPGDMASAVVFFCRCARGGYGVMVEAEDLEGFQP